MDIRFSFAVRGNTPNRDWLWLSDDGFSLDLGDAISIYKGRLARELYYLSDVPGREFKVVIRT